MRDLDPEELARRVTETAGRAFPGAHLAGLRRLEGGVSSLTYAATLTDDTGDREVVVKFAPPGLAPVRNRDVLRQARVLRRLSRLPGFPVPAVLFEDRGDPPGVPPMFGMELVPGESYEPLLDVSETPPSPAVAAERMHVAARALARLQAAGPTALGLADEPTDGVADELGRWGRLFDTVDPDIGAGHERLFTRLAARVPAGVESRVLHGDFRLANMLFDGAELAAVIDWEIWSVGDPRSDLAWLLMHLSPRHVFHENRPPADVAAGAQMPSREQLIEDYVDTRCALGADEREARATTDDLAWFLGVCYYKTASTIAAIYKRDRKSANPDPSLAVAAGHLGEVLAAGHDALSGI